MSSLKQLCEVLKNIGANGCVKDYKLVIFETFRGIFSKLLNYSTVYTVCIYLI